MINCHSPVHGRTRSLACSGATIVAGPPGLSDAQEAGGRQGRRIRFGLRLPADRGEIGCTRTRTTNQLLCRRGKAPVYRCALVREFIKGRGRVEPGTGWGVRSFEIAPPGARWRAGRRTSGGQPGQGPRTDTARMAVNGGRPGTRDERQAGLLPPRECGRWRRGCAGPAQVQARSTTLG